MLVIIVHVFNVCCGHRMVMLGKRWAHFISEFVGVGLLIIVFSIVVVGCFVSLCACLNLFGHVFVLL